MAVPHARDAGRAGHGCIESMSLDRYIALVFVLLCLVYGHTAFITMDQGLPPFMQLNPIWPSTFPKVLSVLGVLVGTSVLLGIEKSDHTAESAEINYRKLTEYRIGQALALLSLMAVYAVMLRPAGFIVSTVLFLMTGSAILGERRWIIMSAIASIASVFIWYLVDQVLGIFMRPLPAFLS